MDNIKRFPYSCKKLGLVAKTKEQELMLHTIQELWNLSFDLVDRARVKKLEAGKK